MFNIDDSFQRDGNQRNHSHRSGHTVPIVSDDRRVSTNMGQSLRYVGGLRLNVVSLDDSFRRDVNRPNRSRGSGHTALIVYDYRRVLSNRGHSLGCVGALRSSSVGGTRSL